MKRRALIAALAALSASAFAAPAAYAQRNEEDSRHWRGGDRGRAEQSQDDSGGSGAREWRRVDENEGQRERDGRREREWRRPEAPAQPPQTQQPNWQPPPQTDDGRRGRGGGWQQPDNPQSQEDWTTRQRRQWQDQDRGPRPGPPAEIERRPGNGQPAQDWRRRGDQDLEGGPREWNRRPGDNDNSRPREWNGRRPDGDDNGRPREWNARPGGNDRGGEWRDGDRDRRGDWNGRDRGDNWGQDDRGRHDRDGHRDRYRGNNDWGRDWNGHNRGSDWRRWDWNRDHHNYDRWRSSHRDFYRPRYSDWRHVRHGYYFDDGYRSIVRLFFGSDYYWWSYPNWRRPYRPWRVGYYLPDSIWWEPVPYDLYWRLPPAPYGCRYIMVDRDILLISVVDGLILDALLYYDPYDRYARY